ncbi:MAG: HEPN domain-containing protein [Acidimicrobiales bacterium]
MPRPARTRAVSAAHVRGYVRKAEEYVAAAASELAAGRTIAATSLAIHAAINAADAVTGARLGKRSAGEDHDQVLGLLRDAGKDGAEVERNLERLLPLKTKAEYEPDDIPKAEATRAVERAQRCVAVARAVASAQT